MKDGYIKDYISSEEIKATPEEVEAERIARENVKRRVETDYAQKMNIQTLKDIVEKVFGGEIKIEIRF